MARQPEFEANLLLQRSVLFRYLDSATLARLAACSTFSTFAAGHLIFAKGEPGDSMMIVASGRVKIASTSEDGDEIILNIIEPGQVFGEMALLDGRERSADATAQSQTLLLKLTRRAFIDFLNEHPIVAVALMEVLCARIRRTTEQVEDAMFLNLPSRLLRRVEELARSYGRRSGKSVEIVHGLSQQEIGETLGVTRESINKQFRAWRELGLIELRRGRILVKDMDALIEEVHGRSHQRSLHEDNLPSLDYP